jgi:hypothetical protein
MAAVILYKEAKLISLEKRRNQDKIYNIGSEDQTSVKTYRNSQKRNETRTHWRSRQRKRLERGCQNMLLDINKTKNADGNQNTTPNQPKKRH